MGKTVENCDRSLRNIIAISIDPLLNTERIYFPARDCPFNLYSQAANKSAGRRPPPPPFSAAWRRRVFLSKVKISKQKNILKTSLKVEKRSI